MSADAPPPCFQPIDDATLDDLRIVRARAHNDGRVIERARVLSLLPRLRAAVDIAASDCEEAWCIELRAALTEYEAAIRSGKAAP